MRLASTEAGPLACAAADGRHVHRVGYAPVPWGWTPWQYAENGVFSGRWDDPVGRWRTLYVGDTRLACFLEVLAPFRPDPAIAEELAVIDVEAGDAALYPTAAAGSLPISWLVPRLVGEAILTGWYAIPGNKESLPTLRQHFHAQAIRLRLPDVDAAAIRLAEPREFTQSVAAWIYLQESPDLEDGPLAGVQFESRHGDDLLLWAIFERPDDGDSSSRLTASASERIDIDDPSLCHAMRLHRLSWA